MGEHPIRRLPNWHLGREGYDPGAGASSNLQGEGHLRLQLGRGRRADRGNLRSQRHQSCRRQVWLLTYRTPRVVQEAQRVHHERPVSVTSGALAFWMLASAGVCGGCYSLNYSPAKRAQWWWPRPDTTGHGPSGSGDA